MSDQPEMQYNGLKGKLMKKPFFIKLFHWEFWPMHLVYLPVYAYYLFLSMKARSLFFFSAANPGIESGGMFFDSKNDILSKVPENFLPTTILVEPGTSFSKILAKVKASGLEYPMIAKPDIGERGFMVNKIKSEAELKEYVESIHSKFLIQEFIGYPNEFSVLYYRFPDEEKGHVSSFTIKEYLGVTGDGESSLEKLILSNPRALLQLGPLEEKYKNQMDLVLKKGEHKELIHIGNHCKGTTFYNGNHLIDEQLTNTFAEICDSLDGIYFGRYDLKCPSLEDLKKGKDIKILEINGAKAEPTHIYQPGYSLMTAYKDLFKHWNTIYQISIRNKKEKGIEFMPRAEGFRMLRAQLRKGKVAKGEIRA